MGLTTLTIGELGPKGDGICFSAGRQNIYVERAIPGDRLRALVQKDGAGIPRGEITEILQPSPYRQKPPCPHYDRCGNCTLQHLTPDFYRDWKRAMVRDAFRRQGLKPQIWGANCFVGSQNRRRVTFSARKIRGGIVFGYYRRRSQEITEIDSCLVADPKIVNLRNALKPFLNAILLPDRTLDLFLQLVDDKIELVLTGPLVHRAVGPLMQISLDGVQIVRIGWREKESDNIQILSERGLFGVRWGALNVALPPAAFLQSTPEGERMLVNAVLSALPQEGKFADLFSGCGTFTGSMLTRGSVDSFESNPAAVKSLTKAAGSLPLRVFRRDLFLNPLRRDEINRYDAVVFDPPRAGCYEQAVELASASAPILIGVSCNPATLARDSRILCDGGYRLQALQVVDQFLYSHHVEVVGIFTKAGRRRKRRQELQ